MKRRITIAILLAMFAISILSSCKGQDCPAYDDFKGRPSSSVSY